MFKPALVMNYLVTSGFIWGIMTRHAVNRHGTYDLFVCRIMLNLVDAIISIKWWFFNWWISSVAPNKNVHDGMADQSSTKLLHDSASPNA